MSERNIKPWSSFAKFYDPLKVGSIDGTDIDPHDKGIIRALNSEYKPNKHVKGNSASTIFVSRLSPKTTKDTIKEIFSKFGKLKRFRLVKDIVTGFPKGYAFIEYESETAAEEAYRKAYKMNIDGHIIFVDFECERLLKGWKPRRLGGGFGGKKESGQLRFGCRDRPFRKPISLEIKDHEAKLKQEKGLHVTGKSGRDERKYQNRNYNRRKSPEGTIYKRKRSRSADRDKKRGRSKERRTNTEKKSDANSSKVSKSEGTSEQGTNEEMNKKKHSESNGRSRSSKGRRTSTEKNTETAINLETRNTSDATVIICKESPVTENTKSKDLKIISKAI